MGVAKTLKLSPKLNPYSLGVNSLYCTKCGRENPANSVFCQYCGGELEMRENYFYVPHSLSQKLKKIFLYDLLIFLSLFLIFSNLSLSVYLFNLKGANFNWGDFYSLFKNTGIALLIIFSFQSVTLFFVLQKSSIFLLERNAKKALLVSGLLGLLFSLGICFLH